MRNIHACDQKTAPPVTAHHTAHHIGPRILVTGDCRGCGVPSAITRMVFRGLMRLGLPVRVVDTATGPAGVLHADLREHESLGAGADLVIHVDPAAGAPDGQGGLQVALPVTRAPGAEALAGFDMAWTMTRRQAEALAGAGLAAGFLGFDLQDSAPGYAPLPALPDAHRRILVLAGRSGPSGDRLAGVLARLDASWRETGTRGLCMAVDDPSRPLPGIIAAHEALDPVPDLAEGAGMWGPDSLCRLVAACDGVLSCDDEPAQVWPLTRAMWLGLPVTAPAGLRLADTGEGAEGADADALAGLCAPADAARHDRAAQLRQLHSAGAFTDRLDSLLRAVTDQAAMPVPRAAE